MIHIWVFNTEKAFSAFQVIQVAKSPFHLGEGNAMDEANAMRTALSVGWWIA